MSDINESKHIDNEVERVIKEVSSNNLKSNKDIKSLSLTENIGLDSFDLAEMTVKLDDIFGVDVFEDEVVDTVGEVIDKIKTKR